MKLADINNIELGYPRTVGYGYERNVPTSYPQVRHKHKDDDGIDDVEDIEKEIDKIFNIIDMTNSWAPFADVPNIRKIDDPSNLL